MREILFRGKRKSDEQWIYGRLSYNGLGDTMKIIENNFFKEIQVLSDTIGQYTGLTDKNGKKIFEGDLLLSNGSLIWLVAFENGAFVCKDERFETFFNFYEHSDYDFKTKSFKSYISEDYKVIGNIHDNPELLKGGAE